MARRTLTLLTVLSLPCMWGPAVEVGARSARVVTRAPALLQFHRLWRRPISPNADSAPAYLAHAGSPRSSAMVFVLAANNGSNCNPGDPVRKATLYGLNATTGAVRWTRSTSGPSRCSTAGPVVDASGRRVYAPGLDGKIHRYDASSGRESTTSGWPVTVTLMPDVEKVAATPTISHHHLYVTTSGFIGDGGHYQGHLLTIDLSSGKAHVFNSLCSNIHLLLGADSGKSNYCTAERSGMFGRGQGVVDPISRAVYVVTGNGAWNGRTNWGDSILKLNSAGTKLLDSYTPNNQKSLDDADQDLGSTGPAILPPIRQNGRTYHLLVQGGKGPACGSCSGVGIHLLNRDNLSGQGGAGHLGGDLFDAQAPGGCEILTAPVVWKPRSGFPWVFYANGCGLAAYRVSASAGHFRLDRVWSSKSGGTTPIVSGSVLYVASSGHLIAFVPSTGKQLADLTSLGNIHWEYPRIVGQRLFISDESGAVSCYAIST